MDGTFAGDGPGPRCMNPKVKNIILASADQVAIDAVAASLMGFDPLKDCKYIRLAHEMGLGCGDINEIEIAGDVDAANERWHFDGPFKEMTFAARQQHNIYWGPLKKPIEWSLKTWLAPWSYLASVIYHDMYWYPIQGRKKLYQILKSPWGRLFDNWELLAPDPDGRGYPDLGPAKRRMKVSTSHILEVIRLLGMAIVESPEWKKDTVKNICPVCLGPSCPSKKCLHKEDK
jgi:hypothetical protein